MKTLGQTVSDLRKQRALTLKDFAQLVRKEDGGSVSGQYLHDIEHDRRTPSPRVLAEIAAALKVSPLYLSAVVGHCPTEVTDYLKANPETAEEVVALFRRATATTKWSAVAK